MPIVEAAQFGKHLRLSSWSWLKQASSVLWLAFLPLSISVQIFATETSFINTKIQVLDIDKKPVKGIVITLIPKEGPQSASPDTLATMAQKEKSFLPRILVVQMGSSIRFPNQDPIKHHVYSFSKPKPFQLKLYRDKDPKPLLFDKPGVVALGCNIHDWMLGYIYVTQTPYFGRTNDKGHLTLKIPPGEYTLTLWHPLLNEADQAHSETITVTSATSHQVQLKHRQKVNVQSSGSSNPWGDY